jgi:hypothetical protein
MSSIIHLAALIDQADACHRHNKTLLADARAHLEHLNAQISAFLRDENHQPPRSPGIFLCQIAVHLRGLANELDGGVATGERT